MAKILVPIEPQPPEVLPPAEIVKGTPAMRQIARRVIELVDGGLTEKQAALQVSPLSFETLMRRDDFVSAITAIRRSYGDVPEEDQRQLIKAGWTKQMIEGLLSDDPVMKKLGQDASKLLAPQVGLQQQPSVQVGVQIGGDLAPLLKDADIASVIREDGDG